MISNFSENFIYGLVVVLALYSCDARNRVSGDEDNPGIGTASIEKLDSITIGFLGNPTVQDLDPVSQTVIFMDRKEHSEDILIADFEGEIINSFSKQGDMPDSYGRINANLRILSDNTFLVYGSSGFCVYDYAGENILKIKHDIDPLNYVAIGMGGGLEAVGEKFLYWNATDPGMKHNDLGFYEEAYLLSWIYPEAGREEPIIKFPESSLFRSGKYFARDSWSPVFTVSNDLIHVVFGMEPVIYTYQSSPPYSLLSTIPLDLPDYQYYKGADRYDPSFEIKWFASRYGQIGNVKKMGDVFLLTYFPGYDVLDRKVSTSNLSPEERGAFRARMSEKYSSRLVVLDSMGMLLAEIDPGNLWTGTLIVRNGELWMMEKLDTEIERDYFRLFRVQLKLE